MYFQIIKTLEYENCASSLKIYVRRYPGKRYFEKFKKYTGDLSFKLSLINATHE